MPTETKRKFLLKSEDWRALARGILYLQAYLSTKKGWTVRVRLVGNQGYLTIKGSIQGISRAEYEYPISAEAAQALLDNFQLIRIWVDAGFSGTDFLHSIMDLFGCILDVVLRPRGSQGFVLLPKRWPLQHTYSWLHWGRRLNLDYERLPTWSEFLIDLAMMRLMLPRLA